MLQAASLVALLTAAQAASPSPSLDQLAWMAGCWRLESGARVVDEIWMAPAGGAMLGMSRTVSKGRVVEFEFIQIREDAGRVAFVARPSGQPEATFALVKAGSGEAVFENPAHDFPQRIIYRLKDAALVGRIEGIQNGKARGADFPYQRVACPQ